MAPNFPFRDINVHASPSHYAFSSPSTPTAPTLVIERPTGDIRLTEEKRLGSHRISSIMGILGIITLRLDKYIIVINKAIPAGRIKGNMVYKVISTELLPLRERALNDLDENRYRSIIQDLLKTSPLYFSYTFDITNSLQRQSEADLTLPLWQRADNRFFWNRFVQSDLIDFSVGKNSRFGHGRKNPGVDPYILPVMFGMLEVRNTSIKGTPLTFILTSRRSRFRAGTRYNSRGIDENGQVSNFNETEQIIILNDEASKGPVSYAGDAGMQYDKLRAAVGKEAQVLSYVQTRGSMPFYWAEVNNLHYTPNLHIRGVDSAMPAVKNHFDEQLAIYGDQYLVNLVKHTGREKRAKEAYEQVVRNLVTGPTSYKEGDQFTSEKIKLIDPSQSNNKYDNIHYIYFDFHNETKGLQFHRTKHLLQQLDQSIRDNAYFRAVDMPGDSQGKVETRSRQTAAVRTNCMDCLDRTNVVQSMVGKHVLTRQLIDLGLLREGETVDSDQAFNHLFRNVWADNADVVSKAYSGTGALKTDFTRTGDRTHKGKFNDLTNSITRYIKNNFLDGPRQDAFDVFLGTYKPNTSQLGKGSIFSDKRPLVVQSIPYILMASLILLFVGFVTRQEETAAVWPLRLAMIVSFIVAVVSFTFMWQYGMLYVNWPKLNTPQWAIEGYQDTLVKVRKNPVVGGFLQTHERGRSRATVEFMEEGKKRIE